jgi:hypothetical protein
MCTFVTIATNIGSIHLIQLLSLSSISILLLQKQAAYYAKQQASIQSQLEASLAQSAQQLVEEIATQAAVQAHKPFALNQFTQQQRHLHQHIHHPGPNMGPFQPQQPYPNPTAGYDSNQQQGYNMHYNYNMVVS